MRHTRKYEPYSEKCATLEKVCHCCKNCATHAKLRNSFPAANLEKRDALGNMRHTWENAAHLEKCWTLGKMRHTWKNTAYLKNFGALEKMHTRKNSTHFKKYAKLWKTRHIGKHAPHLENIATLGKMRHAHLVKLRQTGCFCSWVSGQTFFCFRRHANETKGSMLYKIDPIASFVCHASDNSNNSYCKTLGKSTPHLANCATLRKTQHTPKG